MNIRKSIEKREKNELSSFAKLSTDTEGRKKPEPESDLFTHFQSDTYKILHSLAFRLLKHKTQVFLSTIGDEFRTRLTHTLEVASVARVIAGGLSLNQDLVEAIALGHDLGHTPFGHMGEFSLNELTPFFFKHNFQSLRVVELIENSGRGLNLTDEVRDGIVGHSKGEASIQEIRDENFSGKSRIKTLEGEVVQFSDWIAYINHDIDDAFNIGLITKDDMPSYAIKVLGINFAERTTNMMLDLITESEGKEHISMSDDVSKASEELRSFLYSKVYKLPKIAEKEQIAREIIRFLYKYLLSNYDKVIEEMPFLAEVDKERGVTDYISFLTDLKAQQLYKKYSA